MSGVNVALTPALLSPAEPDTGKLTMQEHGGAQNLQQKNKAE